MEKCSFQFAIKIAANPYNPRYVDLFSRRPRVIPTFGICVKASLEELDFNPDNIAKFPFPKTRPGTYSTPIVNLTFSYAKKDQSAPYIDLLKST